MRNFKIILLLALFLQNISCKKTEETTQTPSNFDLITSDKWKIKAYSSTSTDPEVQAVIKDWNDEINANALYVTYAKNGTYAYSDSSDVGTWELTGSNKILYGKGTSDELTANIDKLNSSSFDIVYSFSINDSIVVDIKESAIR